MILNPKQNFAVTCDDHCLVVACPGSGKSRVVVRKVHHILQEEPSSRIVCVTFSREGANELKHRLVQQVGEDKMPNVHASTFHSLALAHLRRHRISIRIARDAEINEFMRRALALTGVEMSFEEAASAIQNCKTIPHYQPTNDPTGRLYAAYQELCRKNNVVDFYEIMLTSLKLLKDGSLPVLNATHMLVDEFQDSDEIQYQYMMEHVKTGQVKVTAVGDDDQAIYAFRNSLGFEGMARFEREAKATRVTLDTNYRCHREILSAGDRLINLNMDRMDKRLHASRGRGGNVSALRFPDRSDEAEALCNKLFEFYKADKMAPNSVLPILKGDWCVLARTNFQLEAVEAEFAAHQVPFYKTGKSFWDKAPVSYMLSILQSLTETKKSGIDNLLYWSGVDEESLDLLNEKLENDYTNLFKKDITEKIDLSDIQLKNRKIILSFLEQLPGWVKRGKKKEDESVGTAIHGVANWMLDRADKRPERTRIQIASKALQGLTGSLSSRINTVMKKRKNSEDGVALLTMHASKGLEFTNVWIVGAEENIIPSAVGGQLTDKIIEEERRLMYVAMTRAKDALVISSTADNDESRFVAQAISRQ